MTSFLYFESNQKLEFGLSVIIVLYKRIKGAGRSLLKNQQHGTAGTGMHRRHLVLACSIEVPAGLPRHGGTVGQVLNETLPP